MVFSKKIIADYLIKRRKEIKELEFIEREIKIDIVPNKAISMIGPRRAGKSYLLKSIGKRFKNPFYVDFENVEIKNIKAEEIFEIIALHTEVFGKNPDVLLLDEIQNLEKWNNVVRSLLDRKFKVLISGSSSKLLSKEIATQLRGRTISYFLLPFSFREFLKVKKIFPKKFMSLDEEAKIKKLLREYLNEGSYPEVVLNENEERKRRILYEYHNTILYTDFVERFKLKSIEIARFVFDFFLQNYSNLFSINKIVNFFFSQGLRFGKSTIYEYVEKIPETLSVFFVEKISKSVYERKAWPRKAYICDLGLGNIVRFSEDMGKKMENTVFLELLRKTNKNPLLNFYYWKDSQGREVDFVVKQGLDVKQLIQVTYASSKDEVDKREIKGLLKASELLKCKNLLVITWDYEAEEKVKNKRIKFVPLWKWLLK